MEEQKLKELFEAIKRDDSAEFQRLMTSKSDLSISFGRFPVLSVCYLYDSFGIIHKYESLLLTVKSYSECEEYYEIYKKFKDRAGKATRLYRDKIVTPLEMLAILDDREKIAKLYPKIEKTDEITANIEKIYFLNDGVSVTADATKISFPRGKDIKRLLFCLITCSFILVFSLFWILSVIVISKESGLGTRRSPVVISNERDFAVALKNGRNSFILNSDIYITDSISVPKNLNGNFNGNGHTIFASDKLTGALFNKVSGKISNLNIAVDYDGLEITEDFSLFATRLTGTIENCNISGNINARFMTTEDTYFAGFCIINDGKIIGCSSALTLHADNNANQNAYASTFCSINNGVIENSGTLETVYELDTVDCGAIAMYNYGTISGCENHISVTQTSAKEWHPNTSGFVADNNGTIVGSKNFGDIASVSTNTLATSELNSEFVIFTSGLAINNAGEIEDCENYGKITAKSLTAYTYIGGIACYNTFVYTTGENNQISIDEVGHIGSCKNSGEIVAILEEQEQGKFMVYAGGICGYNFTKIESSENTGKITVTCISSSVFAGGITGYSGYATNISQYIEREIKDSRSDADIITSSVGGSIEAGGIVGEGIGVNISGCGSNGNISFNTKDALAAGIAGYAQECFISHCYSASTFERLNNDADSNASTALIVAYFLFVYNDYGSYFDDLYSLSGIKCPAIYYQIRYNQFNYSNITEVTASNLGVKLYSNYDEMITAWQQ